MEFKSALHYFPLRRVDHKWHPRHVGFGRGKSHEPLHLARGVEQRVVHVDVDDTRSGVGLRGGYRYGLVEISLLDQAQEFAASGHVAAFADGGQTVGGDCERLESGEPERSSGVTVRNIPRTRGRSLGGYGTDVGRGGAAASSDDVAHPVGQRPA